MGSSAVFSLFFLSQVMSPLAQGLQKAAEIHMTTQLEADAKCVIFVKKFSIRSLILFIGATINGDTGRCWSCCKRWTIS